MSLTGCGCVDCKRADHDHIYVPRVARSLDDLRVGMVVAWRPERYRLHSADRALALVGKIADSPVGRLCIQYDIHLGGGYDHITPTLFDDGVWMILFDPPPEPIPVPADAIDRLRAEVVRTYDGRPDRGLMLAARSLIDAVDKADT